MSSNNLKLRYARNSPCCNLPCHLEAVKSAEQDSNEKGAAVHDVAENQDDSENIDGNGDEDTDDEEDDGDQLSNDEDPEGNVDSSEDEDPNEISNENQSESNLSEEDTLEDAPAVENQDLFAF